MIFLFILYTQFLIKPLTHLTDFINFILYFHNHLLLKKFISISHLILLIKKLFHFTSFKFRSLISLLSTIQYTTINPFVLYMIQIILEFINIYLIIHFSCYFSVFVNYQYIFWLRILKFILSQDHFLIISFKLLIWIIYSYTLIINLIMISLNIF